MDTTGNWPSAVKTAVRGKEKSTGGSTTQWPRFQIEKLMDRNVFSLSDGEKQRLAIACSLASGQSIPLLDEPASGLDYAHMMETAAFLKQL